MQPQYREERPTVTATIAWIGTSGAAIELIARDGSLFGWLLWCIALGSAIADPDPRIRRRLSVLLGCIAILAHAPINTDLSDAHFIALGSAFITVLVVPLVILSRTDPGVIRYRILPTQFRWLDVVYVVIAIPLAWTVFEIYFKMVNPDVPTHWYQPPQPDTEALWRLFTGINAVGIWDELFFINTVYAILRSVYPYYWANLGQAIIYASVLYQMAFTGIGPVLVFLFALTQGAMFERSEGLLYVLAVHIIVDIFLLAAILSHYYPHDTSLPWLR